MICPECQGLKIIHVPATKDYQRYDLLCFTCEGTGMLPDKNEFPNHCLACGEPIKSGKWCNLHQESEKYQKMKRENNIGKKCLIGYCQDPYLIVDYKDEQ